MGQTILKYIAQIILIVFSVVLALYLSERIEDRKNKKEAGKLLSKIKSELNENKKILDYWVPYHKVMVKDLDSVSNDKIFVENFINDNSALHKVFTRGTIMGETPGNDAWDIGKSHPLIVNLEYDELLILSKIYNQQESTYGSFPKMIELLVSTPLNARASARDNLRLFKNQLEDITNREIQLMSYYDQAEKILSYQSK